MNNIIKLACILLGTLLITTGCNEKPQTNEEKLSKIMEVQKAKEPDTDETVEIHGFKIPCYLILTPDGLPIEYKSTPYPQITWSSDNNILGMVLNDKYPKNGGDSYRLENFLALKFNQEKVASLMQKFKTGENQVVDIKDGTYILFSTATDDSRVITIGYIKNKPTGIKETQM